MPDYGWAYINLDVLKTIEGPDITGSVAIVTGDTTLSGSKYLAFATASNKVGIGLNFPTVLPAYQLDVSASAGQTTAAKFHGDVRVSGSAFVSGTLRVENLEANTVISSSNLIIADSVIGLGFGDTVGATGSAGDRGLILGITGSLNQALIWDQTSGSFVLGKVGAAGPGRTAFDIPASNLSKLKAGELTGSTGVSGSEGQFGDLKIAGNTLSVEGASKINQDVRTSATGVQFGGTLTTSAVTASSTLKVAGALSASDNTLFVDPTTARVGVNVALPDAFLHVSSSAAGVKGLIVSAKEDQSADIVAVQNKAGATSMKVAAGGETTLTNLTASIMNLSNPATGSKAGPGSYLVLNANKDLVLTTAGGGAVSAVANGANDRIATFSSADALNGEASLTFDGSILTVADDISVAAKVLHTGDTDTFLKFDTDKIEFNAGNETLLTLKEDTQDLVTVGDGGDVDFQVKTSASDNTIFAQGSDGKVGIGKGAPTALLHLSQSNTTANNPGNHLLRIEDGNPSIGSKIQTKPIMLVTASYAGDGWAEGFVGINTDSPQGALHVMSQLDGGNGKHTLIADSGKVGIGTNGINALLHVSSSTADQKTFLVNATHDQSVDVVTVTQKTGATCFKISEAGTTTITDLAQTGGSINNATIGASTAAPVTMTAGAVKYRSKANSDSPYSVVASDYIIGVNTSGGAVEIDLQAASSAGAGRMLIIKDVGGAAGTNNITIDPNGSEKIDGQSTVVIAANSGSVMLFCDGSNYFIAGTR